MAELFENYSLFDSPVYKIPKGKTVALIETFAGIGAQAKALERLGVPFVHHRMIEVDEFAVKSYNAIHGTNFEPSDITKVHGEDLGITDKESFTYLLTPFLARTYPVPERCEGHRSSNGRKAKPQGADSFGRS